ncbi:hypothetical protein MACK_001901 [Theileria orientalis]|uniref:Cullin family profile domain-containing protein n=1 Tax=Theileria orientalis TaxID=68886 RepID=A0A976QUK4_THEOR|nr:hypothetical protein MACK_001901 [Theileria orientalis]
MDTIRGKPKRIFKSSIHNEDNVNIDKYIPEELEYLKSFITSVLSGNDSSRFCRLKIQQFLEECVSYGKSDFLIKEINQLLEELITQMLNKINDHPFESDPTNELNTIALEFVDKELESSAHYYALTKFEICWCNIRLALSDLIKICNPLESSLFKSSSGYTILDKAISYFSMDSVERKKLYEDIETGLLSLVYRYRSGDKVNFCQLYNVVEMFSCIELFERFEKKLLEETSKFYSNLSSESLKRSSFSECYRKFNETIESEKKSCLCYLTHESANKVIEVVKKELLFDNCENLVNPENLKLLLKNNDMDSILLLNSLYVNTKFNRILFDNIFTSSKDICNEIVALFLNRRNYDECHSFVGDLNNYQRKLDTLLKPIMKSSEYLVRLNNFWTTILNKDDNTIEYVTLSLAKHADELFIAYSKQAIESKLKFVLHIFQYLSNKSYFELCYRNMLSMRLLYHKQLSEVHYETIGMLKQECGVNYSCKLRDVIDFYERSASLLVDFKEYLISLDTVKHEKKKAKTSGSKSKQDITSRKGSDFISNMLTALNDLNFSVTLVSLDSWIYKKINNAKPPESDEPFEDAEVVEGESDKPNLSNNNLCGEDKLNQLLSLQNHFGDYYLNKFKKRSLEYYPQLGSAELEVTFRGKTYELQLSIFQAYCLLLFNNYKYINLKQIEDVVKSDYNEVLLRKHLSLLNSMPTPLISFYSESIDFNTCNKNDYFELNLDFHHGDSCIDFRPNKQDLFKLDMNYVTTGRTFEDLLPYIESTIVRYLKQTFEASSVTVFKLFSKNPNFTLTRDQFNKVIDSLVSREFIQFNKTNKEFLQYIA